MQFRVTKDHKIAGLYQVYTGIKLSNCYIYSDKCVDALNEIGAHSVDREIVK